MSVTVSHPGQVNAAGDVKALFYKKFSGMVIAAFKRKTIMDDKVVKKMISSGKSAGFPKYGRASAYYHTSDGADVVFSAINHAEEVITIDGVLIAPVAVDELDQKMNEFEVISRYAEELGSQLAILNDEHVIIQGLLGAREATNALTELAGGSQYIDDNMKNDGGTAGSADDAGVALAIYTGIYTAARTLDENDVPEDGRYCILRPEQYNILVKEVQSNGFSVTNSDYVSGNNGGVDVGRVVRIADIPVYKSNRLPSTNIAASGAYTYHNGDFSKTIGLIGHKNAIGTLSIMEVAFEQKWSMEVQSNLLLAKYARGHKFLLPDALVELILNTLSN